MIFHFFLFIYTLVFIDAIEQNCTGKSFVCANSRCIEEYLTCDNYDHCGDGTDEPSSCPQGCDNNGTTVSSGSMVEDNNWYYVCNKSRWRIVGCMINGKRFSVGDTFFGHMSEFWGRCDLLGSSYIRRHLQGCVDYRGNPVKPGTAYLSDPLFWSMCSGTRQLYYIPSEGTIAINTVRRQVIGCFDGSPTPVPDDEQFIQINDPEHGMGVAYHCRTEGQIDWPEVVPVACIFRNNSSDSRPLEYVGLGDRCFLQNDTTVYFCTISSESVNENLDGPNSTWKYGWELNWNTSDDHMMSNLHSNGYKRCEFGETEKVQTGDNRPTFRMAFGNGLKKIRRRRRNAKLQKMSETKFFDQDVFTFLSKSRV